jgi:hypothetical protein
MGSQRTVMGRDRPEFSRISSETSPPAPRRDRSCQRSCSPKLPSAVPSIAARRPTIIRMIVANLCLRPYWKKNAPFDEISLFSDAEESERQSLEHSHHRAHTYGMCKRWHART